MTHINQKAETYFTVERLDANLTTQAKRGWVAVAISTTPTAGGKLTYTVLYRQLQEPKAFNLKAIDRLMTYGDEDEQAFARALLMDRWIDQS